MKVTVTDAEEAAMTDRPNHTAESEPISPASIVGVSLVATGALVTLAGIAIGGSHLFMSVVRRRISEMELPPGEAAKRKWAQARAAATAGNQAWHNGHSRQPVHSV
jgi:hypothetical protein